jgi:hypothetical protein
MAAGHAAISVEAQGWVERLVRGSSMSDCVRRSLQSEGGRRKRYPSIAFRGGDAFRGAPSYRLTTRPAQVICPSGCLSTGVSSLISDFPKNISVLTYPKSHLELFASHPTRGAYHDRHGRGVECGGRGSVGARWDCRAGWRKACERHLSEQTNGTDAYGKIVWS